MRDAAGFERWLRSEGWREALREEYALALYFRLAGGNLQQLTPHDVLRLRQRQAELDVAYANAARARDGARVRIHERWRAEMRAACDAVPKGDQDE